MGYSRFMHFESFTIHFIKFFPKTLLTVPLKNAWFDRPFHLCIMDLSNQISTFCRSIPPRQYALDILHWSKYLIIWTLFLSASFDGDDIMDLILDMKRFFCLLFFCLLWTDVAWNNTFLCFMLGNCIVNFFGKMAQVTGIMDEISLWFSAVHNDPLHDSGHSPANKI